MLVFLPFQAVVAAVVALDDFGLFPSALDLSLAGDDPLVGVDVPPLRLLEAVAGGADVLGALPQAPMGAGGDDLVDGAEPASPDRGGKSNGSVSMIWSAPFSPG